MSDKFERVRPAMRPEASVVEESPRERAARKAAEHRAHRDGSLDDGTDEFFVEPGVIPDGWTYEWKRHSVLGMVDPSHEIALARAGWEPVPPARHPEMMPKGAADGVIMRDGMILMERPTQMVEMTRQQSLRKARLQVRTKEEQLSAAPPGQFERREKDVNIKKAFEPMEIPE